MIHDVTELLRQNTYPGRGMILGRSKDGGHSIAVYFIMGRSENSRNRIFQATLDGIRTSAYEPEKLADPSLVIYHPVRVLDGRTIITNGNHTDTIRDYLQNGKNFRSALETREFEPDSPIYTPRISGLLERDGSYQLSILKKAEDGTGHCRRCFYEYSGEPYGMGHFISTYKSDGNPPPPFEGEPIPVETAVEQGLRKYANAVWEALNADNKISLYARETVIGTGASFFVTINKNEVRYGRA